MKRYIIICSVILCGACSKPTDTVVPTSIENMESIKPQIQKLKSDEKDLFMKYVMRHAIGNAMSGLAAVAVDPVPDGMTIGKAIEEQRQFMKQQAELIKELRAERERWQFELTSDKFTDEKTAFASIEEENDGGKGFIHVGCSQSGFEVKVGAGKYVGDKYIPENVKYRVDDRKFVVTTMNSASESYVYENDKNSEFLRSLWNGKRIIVELKSHDYKTSTASFLLNGAEPAISKVLAICNNRN